MLNAGFSTLGYLKSRILPAGADEVTDWDHSLEKLGLGVATRFNQFTCRILQRVAGQVDEFNALASAVVLRAFPVEAINTVQIRTFTGAMDTYSAGYILDESAGLMYFGRAASGDGTERVVIDYDGGYWLDDGAAMPAGATALPDDILEAWVMQCQAWAEARNLFHTVALDSKEKRNSPVQLTREVAEILEPYRRYASE